MATLFWTADSPYCRIVLWAATRTGAIQGLTLKHLSWSELNSISPGTTLGQAATVPCLHTNSGVTISDSLRIIAYLIGHNPFYEWLMSTDGEAYRLAEGQLSRVMYALYDNVQGKPLERARQNWLRVLTSLDSVFLRSSPTTTPSFPNANGHLHLADLAIHVLVSFCTTLNPEWGKDLPPHLRNALLALEQKEDFRSMQKICAEQTYGVPCVLAGTGDAG